MKEEQQILVKESWLEVVMTENSVIDDYNILKKMQFLIQKCKEIEKKGILIDATHTTRETSVLKFLELAELIRKQSLDVRIAIVAPHLVNNDDSKTFETFSSNRGIFVRYFSEKVSAMQWLTHL